MLKKHLLITKSSSLQNFIVFKSFWPKTCQTETAEWKRPKHHFTLHCRSISAKHTGIKKRKTTPDRLKIRRSSIKTIDYSISIYIIMLHSYIKAFTCSCFKSNTNHPPVIVHVTATYFIRSTVVY